MTIQDLQETVNKLNEELNFYINERKTKTRSKNIRVLLGEIKKNTADYRRLLIEEDNK